MPASSRGEIERESTPRTAAVPRDGSTRFTRTLIVVVLSAPLGPTRANALPSGISNSSPAARRTGRIASRDHGPRQSLATDLPCSGPSATMEFGPPCFDGVDDIKRSLRGRGWVYALGHP